MTDHSLPENMEEWPEDPLVLFGIEQGANERQLRKAYHRLIKIFKPEHFPEQFRRLNEAYESLKPWLKYHQQEIPEAPPVSDAEDDWSISRSTSASFGSEDPVLDGPPDIDLDAVWKEIITGDSSDAFEKLAGYLDEHPDNEELTLKLFWAAKFDLDRRGQRPIVWLENYLRKSGLSGRVFQLYLMELDRVPRIAVTTGSRELLRVSATDPRLPQLTQPAWIGCLNARNRSRIIEDLDALRDAVAFDSPDIWSQLLSQAAEILALYGFPQPDQLLSKILSELQQCDTNLNDDWYDRRWEIIEQLMSPAGKVDHLIEFSRKLHSFSRRSLLLNDIELRREFQLFAIKVTRDELQGLTMLNSYNRYSPVGLYLFWRYAERTREDRYRWYEENYVEHLLPRIREFLYLFGDERYDSLRKQVPTFCRREDITVDDLINISLRQNENSAMPPLFTDENVSLLDNDIPLKCYVACHRALAD